MLECHLESQKRDLGELSFVAAYKNLILFHLLQPNNLETCVQPLLGTWFEDSVCPIQRVVQLFQEQLAYVLHAVSITQKHVICLYFSIRVNVFDSLL